MKRASFLILAACLACEEATSIGTCFNGASCCPAGSAVRGIASGGQLDCRDAGEPFQDCFIDHAAGGEQSCPDGTYLRGLNPSARTLVCCYDHHRGYTALNGPVACGGDGLGVGVDEEGRLLCRAPERHPPATPAVSPDASLPGEVSGSSDARSFSKYGAQAHALWKKINRNWLAHVFHIPVQTWLELNDGIDPAVGYDADPVRWVCHAPLNGARPCATVPECGEGECRLPQQRIHYASPIDGRDIYAYLFFPPSNLTASVPAERPVVLVTHGHPIAGGAVGKEATGVEADGMYHAAARELAAAGQAIAIAPDARTFNESALPSESHEEAADDHEYGFLPPFYVLENIYNLGIALRASFGRYRADRARVFVGGLSLGGWQAVWAGAIDPRITGVIAGGSFLQVWQTNESCDTHLPGTCPYVNGASDRCLIVPGLSGDSGGSYNDPSRVLLDTADLAALAAPARYLVTWGTSDANFGHRYQSIATDGARAAYAALGMRWRFSQVTFDAAHEWNSTAADNFVAE